MVAMGRRVRLRVSGRCMAPLIKHDDFVVVEALTPAVAPGAIVVARNADNALVCHRVLKTSADVGAGRMWLAGDQHGVLEAHEFKSIIGRVCSIEQGSATVQVPEVPRIADGALARLHFFALRKRGSFFGRGVGFLHRLMLRIVNRRF